MEQSVFERKIKPVLLYVGTIGAILMSIGYIILMLVFVLGFKAKTDLESAFLFAIINAAVGFIIMQFLKIQGIDFAKDLEVNKQILEQWNRKRPKKKRNHSLRWYWFKSITTDILGKALTVGISTAGIIYIVIEGSKDYNMILLSIVNLIMFACFGLISLVKSYEFFNGNYIPYILDLIEEKKKQEQEQEQKEKEKEIEEKVANIACEAVI